eukprot:scaffold10294_cov118-Isochrysis_galbana.AAC.2
MCGRLQRPHRASSFYPSPRTAVFGCCRDGMRNTTIVILGGKQMPRQGDGGYAGSFPPLTSFDFDEGWSGGITSRRSLPWGQRSHRSVHM